MSKKNDEMQQVQKGGPAEINTDSLARRSVLGRVFSPRLAIRMPVVAGVMLVALTVSVAGTGYFVAKEMIGDREHQKMQDLASERAEGLKVFLEGISQDLLLVAENSTVRDAVRSMTGAYQSLDAASGTLQRSYIDDNPHPLGERQKLASAAANNSYDLVHREFHPTLEHFMSALGFADIYIAAPNGDLVYSVAKEADFATNLMNGRWRDTALGAAFRASVNSADGEVSVQDLSSYAPRSGAPTGFMSAPVYGNGKVEGVLIARMPLARIQDMVSREAHMGEHGEVFVVGRDMLMRTDLPLTDAREVLQASFESPLVDQALKGNTSYELVENTEGLLEVAGASAVGYPGLDWVVVSRAQEAELLGALAHLRDMFLIVGIVGLFVSLLITTLSVRVITRRMRLLVGTVERLARGENGVEIPGLTKADELGDIARALSEIDARNVEVMRIKSALDSAAANVMVSDVDLNIVYANEALGKTMKTAEAAIRSELPQFSADNFIGKNIDMFHKKPEHQRSMLARLTDTHHAKIMVGGRSFRFAASPIFDGAGIKIGFVVEWNDITRDIEVEQEIGALVAAAVEGDFSKRLDLEGKEGFQRILADAMNRLCSTTSDAINAVADALSGLSEGDLTRRVEGDFAGLFGKLQGDANKTSEQLSQIVLEIMSAADEVTAAADEISSGTTDLSSRTEQQASNLEETAASMEEMSSTIKQNAENAQQANQLSSSAREVAMRGGSIVENAISAMSRIEESSQKVSDIIGVIDEIAFQTNLLALNAAVEAARAGDAGKGFAVVASEVRTLAQRSSQAAKDIKGLIVDSGAQVKDGVELVNNTGKSLGEIVDSIKRLSDIVSEISAASNEQSTGVEEINRAVSQMDEMTQQNAALVEQSAASAKTLLEQSTGMRERMTFFNVDRQSTSVGALGQQAKASFEARVDPQRTKRVATSLRKVAGSGGAGFVAVDTEEESWKEF